MPTNGPDPRTTQPTGPEPSGALDDKSISTMHDTKNALWNGLRISVGDQPIDTSVELFIEFELPAHLDESMTLRQALGELHMWVDYDSIEANGCTDLDEPIGDTKISLVINERSSEFFQIDHLVEEQGAEYIEPKAALLIAAMLIDKGNNQRWTQLDGRTKGLFDIGSVKVQNSWGDPLYVELNRGRTLQLSNTPKSNVVFPAYTGSLTERIK